MNLLELGWFDEIYILKVLIPLNWWHSYSLIAQGLTVFQDMSGQNTKLQTSVKFVGINIRDEFFKFTRVWFNAKAI